MRIIVSLLLTLFGTPLMAATSLETCAAIDSAVARLDCYDLVARGQTTQTAPTVEVVKPEPPVQPTLPSTENVTPPTPVPAARASTTTPSLAPVAPKAATDAVLKLESQVPNEPRLETAKEENFGITLFGKREESLKNKPEQIHSHIDNIYKSNAGTYVMTLSNGQVWMEREPGRRRIDADQDVDITKLRWHYSMTLNRQGHRVTVQRID